MTHFMADKLTFDAAPRRSPEGYLAVRARAARSGVYDYLGREVDPSGAKFKSDQVVKVYRPESEVFSDASVRSFLMKPVTDDHPSVAVTSDNHSKFSKGVISKAMRDGDHLAFDLVFWDAETIRKIEAGKRELSNGYGVDLDFTSGTTPDGKAYDAIQRNIVGNHVAVVDAGRAGPSCAIGMCDAIPAEEINRFLVNKDTKRMKTILIDGNSVEVSDAAEIAIKNLVTKLSDAETKLKGAEKKADEDEEAKKAKDAAIATKDKEIADLKASLEAAQSPAALDAAIKDREAVVVKAKAIMGDKFATDGKSTAEIRKAVVDAKLADVAKDWTPAQIDASFAALSVDVKADPLRKAVADGAGQTDDAAKVAYEKMLADMYAGTVK